MSHFAVLVVTKQSPTQDVLSNALLPFHEFECTGIDAHIVSEDRTQEYKDEYEETDNGYKEEYATFADFVTKYHGAARVNPYVASILNGRMNLGLPVIHDGDSEKGINEQAKFGWAEIDEDNNVIQVIDRTNPDRKWDWYVVGGRWSNYLRVKSGETVDTCQVKDLDFEGERQRLAKEAGDAYDKIATIAAGVTRDWRSWKELVLDKSISDPSARRDIYNGQPQIQAIRANDTTHMFHPFSGIDIDDLLTPREQFVAERSSSPFCTYNILDNTLETDNVIEQWNGGDMGFFGMGNQKDNWQEIFAKKIAALDPEYHITVVDCHI